MSKLENESRANSSAKRGDDSIAGDFVDLNSSDAVGTFANALFHDNIAADLRNRAEGLYQDFVNFYGADKAASAWHGLITPLPRKRGAKPGARNTVADLWLLSEFRLFERDHPDLAEGQMKTPFAKYFYDRSVQSATPEQSVEAIRKRLDRLLGRVEAVSHARQ